MSETNNKDKTPEIKKENAMSVEKAISKIKNVQVEGRDIRFKTTKPPIKDK